MIAVTLNGQTRKLKESLSLQTYLQELGVVEQAVAIAINGEVVPRSSYSVRILREGDAVEVVRMVGGG